MRPNRREILIERMNELESQGMGCLGCAGTCCTFEANSMLMTPLEASELFVYLKENNLLTNELKAKLEEAVEKYRLEPKYPRERKSYLRKTYTCPFFNHTELGCPLPREVKPYGCLAFDSHHKDLKAGEFCFSEKELLEKRESLHPEEKAMNEEAQNEFGIIWEKAPIPNAVLEFWE
ncbi:MAG: hypothetical protein ACLGHN_13590 [Bacteriovoracia bacterium]